MLIGFFQDDIYLIIRLHADSYVLFYFIYENKFQKSYLMLFHVHVITMALFLCFNLIRLLTGT